MQLLQERDFGQKINASFEFLKLNFKPLMVAMLYIAGPVSLIAGVAGGVYQSNMFSELGDIQSGNPFLQNFATTFTIPYFIYAILIVIASVFASLTVYGYVLEYEKRGGNVPAITPVDVWERVKENIVAYIGYSIVLMFIVIFACLFLIVPGIYIGVCLSLIYFVFMRENLGFGDAMSRCFYLIKDKWWSTFGLIIVMTFIQSIISYVFQIPSMIFMVLKMFHILDAGTTVVATVTSMIGTLGSILTSSLVNLGIVFQYYNLIERREGHGIMNAINSIGTAQTPRTDLREEEF